MNTRKHTDRKMLLLANGALILTGLAIGTVILNEMVPFVHACQKVVNAFRHEEVSRPAASLASVDGSVMNSYGGAVARAAVQLTHKETGVTRQARTDGEGKFGFNKIGPGSYEITVEVPGVNITVQSVHTVEIRHGGLVHVDLQVELPEKGASPGTPGKLKVVYSPSLIVVTQ